MGQSPLTRKLIAEGCAQSVSTPRQALTDRQALIERLEQASGPFRATNAQRRRLLREAADFIRSQTPGVA